MSETKADDVFVPRLVKKVTAFRKALVEEKKKTRAQAQEVESLKAEVERLKFLATLKDQNIITLHETISDLKVTNKRYVSQFGDLDDSETQERISNEEALFRKVESLAIHNAELEDEIKSLKSDNNCLYESVQTKKKELKEQQDFAEVLAQKLFAYKMRLEHFEVIILKFTVYQVYPKSERKSTPAQILVKRIPSSRQMMLSVSSETHEHSQDIRTITNILNDMRHPDRFHIYFNRELTLSFETPETDRERIVVPLQDTICAVGGNEGRPIMRYRKNVPNTALALILRQSTEKPHGETGIFSVLRELGISFSDNCETTDHLADLVRVI